MIKTCLILFAGLILFFALAIACIWLAVDYQEIRDMDAEMEAMRKEWKNRL